MKIEGVDKESWIANLIKLLRGDALGVWTDVTRGKDDLEYSQAKTKFLDRMGYDWYSCAGLFTMTSKPKHVSWDTIFETK